MDIHSPEIIMNYEDRDTYGMYRGSAAAGDGFDGGDLPAFHAGYGGDAGAGGLAVHVHGARATQGSAAAELGAGQAELVAQHPQQRGGRVGSQRRVAAVEL